MTTTVFLVRHGQTKSNVTGFYMGWANEDLDDAGYRQVNSLAYRLAKQPIDSIYSSPLRRTDTTAQIIAKPHGLKVGTSEKLIEIRFGDWEGLHMDEISQRWPELWQQWRTDPSQLTPPNGESFQQVSKRTVRFFDQIASANQGKSAVIVTHEIVVKSVVTHILGAPASIYRRFDINNASLSMVRIIDGKARLAILNDTSHLSP